MPISLICAHTAEKNCAAFLNIKLHRRDNWRLYTIVASGFVHTHTKIRFKLEIFAAVMHKSTYCAVHLKEAQQKAMHFMFSLVNGNEWLEKIYHAHIAIMIVINSGPGKYAKFI
jgi:hypothetical protein